MSYQPKTLESRRIMTETIKTLIEPMQNRLNAANKGPWFPSEAANASGEELCTSRAEKTSFLTQALNDEESTLWLVHNNEVIPAATGDGPRAEANAVFIANAPTDQARLLAAVQAVTALHPREVIATHEGYGEESWCPYCCDHWPCETVSAVVAALGGEA